MKDKLTSRQSQAAGLNHLQSLSDAASNSPNAKQNCIYCQNDLGNIWIECAQCSTQQSTFYFCLKVSLDC